MPANWDNTANLKLLFNIIEQTGAKASWDAISALMGDGFTAEACRQHFAKLKKSTFDGSANPNPAVEGGTGSPVTPSPRKRKPREPKTPGETPTKRPRKNAKAKTEAEIKTEDETKDAPNSTATDATVTA
ncbi:hypothetical protein PRK78_001825 [Emydomyces testavorans]|uniref:Myb-like domain-containing protein n=1 Tax=Emydomyces testavorans TaxID=2070801 RepID=A0AAF0IH20_9EURO|nr:hypothetical protein PRK78_001825 [Emydomyces testavorans]